MAVTTIDAAIVGIGETEYARNIGRSEIRTALEACWTALGDAGLDAADIDGIFQVEGQIGEPWELARRLGLPRLRAWGTMGEGGGAACGPVIQAALAVSSGMCDVALAYRARNRGSGGRPWAATGERLTDHRAYDMPHGLVSPVQQIAMMARRYRYEAGASETAFARVSVAHRNHAVPNPRAVFRDPITTDDVLSSRMIADPLHLLDCCPESDGACAVIVTSGSRARDLRQQPAYVRGIGQGIGHRTMHMTNLHAPDPFLFHGYAAAAEVYASAGMEPGDVDVALLYDNFTPVVLYGLESFGFCGRGEAAAFVEDGNIDGTDCALPVNTHGGSMSEAYIHGFNHVLEGVRQLRGTSSSPVAGAEVALVAAAPMVPTTAVILTKE